MLPIVINILLVIHVLVSLLIVLLVLMQRPKNEGLGAAFGGGMTDNLFGAQTTNVLQTITRWLGFLFFSLTLLLSVLYVRQPGRSAVQQKLSAPTVIPATPAPATPAPAPAPGTPEALPAAGGEAPVKLEQTPGQPATPVADPAAAPVPAPETPKAPDAAPATPAAPAAPEAPKADAPAAPDAVK